MKILILGSGALKIGEAGEFDYSGSQALKALKEEGIKTVLINPNIATIQTSPSLADTIYFLPITDYFVTKVIEKEKPDGIFLSFGGQTALNCGVSLYKKGILKKYGIKVLGTPVNSIILTEDREKFAQHLRKLQIATPVSQSATTVNESIKVAETIGYPLMVRAAFALGGQNSGLVTNKKELISKVTDALSFSPQVLIEKYLHHYKEVEYEVVRDKDDNCITVCNMENMDPLGIHTGESIVVAPTQTLTNYEYHKLREISMKIVRSLKVVGECNVQFALNPSPQNGEIEYFVIEMNARLSRSSALASKATGYPLAYVAAKLALGKSLLEIKNQVTQVTQACFEPALDYVVVKIPRWDLDKFKGVKHQIGSSMKSVGEVMGIGRSFEEALQKSIRMLDTGAQGVTENNFPKNEKEFNHFINIPTPRRLFALAEALRRGKTIDELYQITGIDPWFLYRVQNIVQAEKKLKTDPVLTAETLLSLKQLGFSDKRIGYIINQPELAVRAKRKSLKITPSFFQIDTLAGEVPAKTNYLYATYCGSHHDIQPLGKRGVLVLGSGPYHIGSSVEFDWTCVNTALSLKNYHKQSVIINCNPETVSTDYDISDRLYFEELTFERISDIYEFEDPEGIILSVGGQIPNNLAQLFADYGCRILGTTSEHINQAEDRNTFSRLLDRLEIMQPQWNQFVTVEGACNFAARCGYPVLIRPSYVLSGSAMNVCYTQEELKNYIKVATDVSHTAPITVSKFINEAKELEFDGVAQEGKVLVYAISEHVEHAGVHSGDATIVYPPHKIYLQTERKIIEIGKKLAQALEITGPFNIQFMAKDSDVYVIEINVRASRTLPFISKATKVNFAMMITDALFNSGKKVVINYPDYVAVKSPQFSFARLEGADPTLRVEMASTGEAASFGNTLEEAFLKAELSVGARIPQKGIFISLGGEENKVRFLTAALRLQKFKLPLYATEKTAQFLKNNGIKVKRLYKLHDKKTPNLLYYLQNKKIDLAINIVDPYVKKDINDDYVIRRAAIDHNIHLITNRQKANLFIKALTKYKAEDLLVKSWNEYS